MSTKAAPRRPAKSNRRFQIALETQLARVQGRVRALDCLSALLVLVVTGLGYLAGVVLLDHFLRFPDWLRQLALAGLGIGSVAYLVYALVLPLRRQVNPYYAARALELSEPESKNALVNWLDLRGEPLPPVIREAVQRQAVEELDQADVEEAVPSRRPLRLFYLTAGLLILMIALRVILPEQFSSLLARALFPFSPTAVPRSTRFELVLPVKDEVSPDPLNMPILQIPVEPGLAVSIAATVEGKMPDAVFVEYQHTLAEKPRTKPLLPPSDEERRPYWTTSLGSDLIPADGLFFRLRGGDGQSRQYQLVVTSKKPPSLADYDILYHYPKYTAIPPKHQHHAPLKAIVGTKVDITLIADQPVKIATLDIQAGGRIVESFTLNINTNHEDRMRGRVLTLPKQLVMGPELRAQPTATTPGGKATYSITLVGKEGKADTSPPYAIDIEDDLKPQVTIDKIGQAVIDPDQKEVRLAANDVTTIFGRARDDIAVNSVRLRLSKLPKDPKDPAKGQPLFALGFKDREGPLQKPVGTYLPPADYQLTLDLTKLTEDPKAKDPKAALQLQKDDRLELWVEALDDCEPDPNLGESRRLIIILNDPLKKEEQEQKQKENQEQEKQREKEQEQKRKNDKPEPGKKEKPEPGKDDKPEPGKKEKPEPGKDDKPEPGKKEKPEPGKDDKPEPGKKEKPEPGKDDKPEPGKKEKPEPGKDDKPEPGKKEKPEPGKDDKPEPGKKEKPEPGKDDKPEPGKKEKPEPGKDDKPEPGKDDKPEPGKKEKPEPGKDDKPEPGKKEKPEPGKDDKPEPGKDDKPEPGKKEKPEPGKDDKPEPGKKEKPEPGKDDKPEPGKKEKPEPGKDDKPEPDKGNAAAQKQAEDLKKKADELAKAMGGGGTEKPKDRADTKTPTLDPDAVNIDDARRAKDLQLDTLADKLKRGEVDKKLLAEKGWTDQDTKNFLKQHEAGQLKKGTGGMTGTRRDATSGRISPDAIVNDPNAPPPELRDAFDRLRKRQAEAGIKK